MQEDLFNNITETQTTDDKSLSDVEAKVIQPRKKLKKYTLTAGCIFCNKLFTSFSYAANHINNSHARLVTAYRMNYPINYGCDPNMPHRKPIEVWLEKPPGIKGVDKVAV